MSGSISGLQSIMSCKSKTKKLDISLAQWSLHRSLRSGKIDNLDFAKITKEKFGINAIEYVNTFFFEKAKDKAYLAEMRMRAEDIGVSSLLIMCDNEGSLGNPDSDKRNNAVESHYKWHEAAKYLGCHSIRVNAYLANSFNEINVQDYHMTDTYQDQIGFAAEGLRKLTEFGAALNMNTIVENHGGLSSNGSWLAAVVRAVDHPRCGTLPDFGNFLIAEGMMYDRYKGVKELMPYAKAVSAKSNEFDLDGQEINTDYYKMMRIVIESGYSGFIGIEYEGNRLDEISGIIATKELLIKSIEKLRY